VSLQNNVGEQAFSTAALICFFLSLIYGFFNCFLRFFFDVPFAIRYQNQYPLDQLDYISSPPSKIFITISSFLLSCFFLMTAIFVYFTRKPMTLSISNTNNNPLSHSFRGATPQFGPSPRVPISYPFSNSPGFDSPQLPQSSLYYSHFSSDSILSKTTPSVDDIPIKTSSTSSTISRAQTPYLSSPTSNYNNNTNNNPSISPNYPNNHHNNLLITPLISKPDVGLTDEHPNQNNIDLSLSLSLSISPSQSLSSSIDNSNNNMSFSPNVHPSMRSQPSPSPIGVPSVSLSPAVSLSNSEMFSSNSSQSIVSQQIVPARRSVINYSLFLSFYYFIKSAGYLLLYLESDISICLIDGCILMYMIIYTFLLYRTLWLDAKYWKAVFDSVLVMPLTGSSLPSSSNMFTPPLRILTNINRRDLTFNANNNRSLSSNTGPLYLKDFIIAPCDIERIQRFTIRDHNIPASLSKTNKSSSSSQSRSRTSKSNSLSNSVSNSNLNSTSSSRQYSEPSSTNISRSSSNSNLSDLHHSQRSIFHSNTQSNPDPNYRASLSNKPHYQPHSLRQSSSASASNIHYNTIVSPSSTSTSTSTLSPYFSMDDIRCKIFICRMKTLTKIASSSTNINTGPNQSSSNPSFSPRSYSDQHFPSHSSLSFQSFSPSTLSSTSNISSSNLNLNMNSNTNLPLVIMKEYTLSTINIDFFRRHFQSFLDQIPMGLWIGNRYCLHRNLAQCYGLSVDPPCISLIFEYGELGTLYDILFPSTDDLPPTVPSNIDINNINNNNNDIKPRRSHSADTSRPNINIDNNYSNNINQSGGLHRSYIVTLLNPLQIAQQISSAMNFLQMWPEFLSHPLHLTPSNIMLDVHLNVKIADLEHFFANRASNVRSNINNISNSLSPSHSTIHRHLKSTYANLNPKKTPPIDGLDSLRERLNNSTDSLDYSFNNHQYNNNYHSPLHYIPRSPRSYLSRTHQQTFNLNMKFSSNSANMNNNSNKKLKNKRRFPNHPAWLAPEILAGGQSNKNSAVYSFAMILWSMLTWSYPSILIPRDLIDSDLPQWMTAQMLANMNMSTGANGMNMNNNFNRIDAHVERIDSDHTDHTLPVPNLTSSNIKTNSNDNVDNDNINNNQSSSNTPTSSLSKSSSTSSLSHLIHDPNVSNINMNNNLIFSMGVGIDPSIPWAPDLSQTHINNGMLDIDDNYHNIYNNFNYNYNNLNFPYYFEEYPLISLKECQRLIVTEKCQPWIPVGCPKSISKLLKLCWNFDPEQRPSFSMISEYLLQKETINAFAQIQNLIPLKKPKGNLSSYAGFNHINQNFANYPNNYANLPNILGQNLMPNVTMNTIDQPIAVSNTPSHPLLNTHRARSQSTSDLQLSG
jgi:hypothetical protein